MSMFIHPEWSLFRPSLWQFPEWKMTGTSSFKYSEDNTDITYAISLPENADEDGIGATIKDGVLIITIPKFVEEQPVAPGTIKVKRG